MVIERIEIRTANIDALAAFYADRLGVAVNRSSDDTITITAGRSEIVFGQADGFSGRYHFAFNIPENRLAAAVDYLTARQIALITDSTGESVFSFDSWNAHAVYFYDPAGNIVELIARHDLTNAVAETDVPFTPVEILSVSEIGLPTDDVPALVATLTEALGINAYQQSTPTFTAVGDENGLFILVQTGRLWFPDTGIPAESVPVQIVVKSSIEKPFTVQNGVLMIE